MIKSGIYNSASFEHLLARYKHTKLWNFIYRVLF